MNCTQCRQNGAWQLGIWYMCPTVVQKLDTTTLNQHGWQHRKELEVPPHTITTDRQFTILFLTMSVWFEGVGPTMLNIIFHLKLLLTTTISHCFWETKCLKPEKSNHADSLPHGSWFYLVLCGCSALVKPWHSPSPLDLICMEEEEPPNTHSVPSTLVQHNRIKCPAVVIPRGCCGC